MTAATLPKPPGPLFREYVYHLVDAPQGYEWGKENRMGTDCSGTVCYPLIMMGYRIRTTAQGLYEKVFTKPLKTDPEMIDLSKVAAIFYVSTVPWKKLDGVQMPAGTVRHVCPVVGEWVVCHADWKEDRIVLKTARSVRLAYEAVQCRDEWREIDWEAARRISAAGKDFHDPDPELMYWTARGTS